MKHISILIPKGHTSVSNIEGTHHIFSEVNYILKTMGKKPIFNVQLVGVAKEESQRNGLYKIGPEALTKNIKKTDLIIIPAIHGEPEKAYEENKELADWVVKQYNNGAEVVGFCLGTFFIASMGLLTGKQCATHWGYANKFRKLFPDANLVDDKIMTEDDGIYTSGGAYSFLNLNLYLVEKFAGREIAIMIAKAFMVDIDRTSQSPFIIFQGQKAHEDEPIKKAQEFIEKNFHDKITVDQLALMLAMGRRSLERRFKSATSNTVTEYIQRVKIEAAKKSLETTIKNVNEVMYDVGYSDTKAFRGTFKKITGMSPVKYRTKYNKNAYAA